MRHISRVRYAEWINDPQRPFGKSHDFGFSSDGIRASIAEQPRTLSNVVGEQEVAPTPFKARVPLPATPRTTNDIS